MTTPIPYAEGDVFAVPIAGSQWVVGVCARKSERIPGLMLGYFFADVFDHVPMLSEFPLPTRAAAIYVKRSSDLGLITGAWPIIGSLASWQRRDWPMPSFAPRPRTSAGPWFEEIYDDGDPGIQVAVRRISADAAHDLPESGSAGFKFVEKRLARLVIGAVPAEGTRRTPTRNPTVAFGSSSPLLEISEPNTVAEQAVIIHYRLSNDGFGTSSDRDDLNSLEEDLIIAVRDAAVGEVDGSEVGQGEGVIFMYGSNGDEVWAVVESRAKACPLRPAYGIVRVGGPGSPQRRIDL